MFILKEQEGEHSVYVYDTTVHKFKNYLEKLYEHSVDDLLSIAEDYKKYNTPIENLESDLHKHFYKTIKSTDEFKEIYCAFIQDIHKQFFPEEPYLIYQSYPSIRLQYPNNIAIPPHYDSDDIGCHPIGERNFLIPITSMHHTTRLFVEKYPNTKNYIGFNLEYGDLLYFNGNKCTHYNECNKEGYIRVSFDFRVITPKDYYNYIMNYNVTTTNPRDIEKLRKPIKMIIGGYYQIVKKDAKLQDMMQWYYNKEPIAQSRPLFEEEEKEAVYNYMTTGDPFITEFRETKKLENAFSELTNSKYVCMTPSGTSAIILALLACDIKPNDEVIVPSYTMVATANAITLLGAKPIFVDVHPETYTLDVHAVKYKITHFTKAIIHVSLNNYAIHLEDLVLFCKERNIWLIEDAAQSVGASYNGQSFGTFGDIGCFSLSTPKIISTGQGGVVITNNCEIATKINSLKNFGREQGGIEVYNTFGVNFKFTDLQAVIGLEQIKKVPSRKIRLREIYNQYYSKLATYMKEALDNEWFPWFITIEIDRREILQQFLKQHQVETRISYPAVYSTGDYSKNQISLPNTEHISKKGLFLPTHLLLKDIDIHYICDLILLFKVIY